MRWFLVNGTRDADYLACLEQARSPLGQHALGYHDALAECPHEEPLRVVAYEGDRPVGAAAGMLYRGGPVPLVESLPYGFGGVISGLEGEARQRCLAFLCDALVEAAEQAGARLVTIQTPPFPDGPDPYREAFRPDYELRSFVQYVDLVRDFQPNGSPTLGKYGGYRGNLRRNHRRNIRTAEMHGVSAGLDPGVEAFERYYILHQQRMAEVGGRPRPEAFFRGIYQRMLPEGTGWFFYAKQNGLIVSGTPLIGVRETLDMVLICLDSAAEEMQPNALLCYRAMEWAAETGFRILNFQSSLRRGDSLYHWKVGWGAREAPVSIMTRVIGDLSLILRLPLADLREAYTYHYVLPYSVLEAARAGRPIDTPGLRVLDKGA